MVKRSRPGHDIRKFGGAVSRLVHAYQQFDVGYLIPDLADLFLDLPAVEHVLAVTEIYDVRDLFRRKLLVYRDHDSPYGHEAEIGADPFEGTLTDKGHMFIPQPHMYQFSPHMTYVISVSA